MYTGLCTHTHTHTNTNGNVSFRIQVTAKKIYMKLLDGSLDDRYVVEMAMGRKHFQCYKTLLEGMK